MTQFMPWIPRHQGKTLDPHGFTSSARLAFPRDSFSTPVSNNKHSRSIRVGRGPSSSSPTMEEGGEEDMDLDKMLQ